MKPTMAAAVTTFGALAKEKLTNPAAEGQPEDQLRAPLEGLIKDLAEVCGLPRDKVVAVGEASQTDLKTRPDYAISVQDALAGFIEVKAPGKGADPRKFKDPHDRQQWERLQSLPNLIYTDGSAFSLWHNGTLAGEVVNLEGDIETAGDHLKAPTGLLALFDSFLRWEPIAPRTAKDLAHVVARLCRLLRDEVTEQLAIGSEALTALATDWRKLLFPDATDERFADGYAQAVTFGLLMSKAMGISFKSGLQQAAAQLTRTSTLIGEALRILTFDADSQNTLRTSLGTLMRVLEAVDWSSIRRRGHGGVATDEHSKAETWLYFYEDFLEVYDNELRKRTGSYYTPPQVVGAMIGLVDEALRRPGFSLHAGMASNSVTLADPAMGTGTFLLGILQRIARTVREDQGEGAVSAAVQDALHRVIAFELQLGPFAVAQLRFLAEIVDLTGGHPATPPRLFVTDTLGDPEDLEGWVPALYGEIARFRQEANKIKREQPITVVLGNPPYKEKAKGFGGWVEGKELAEWMPPTAWKVGAHAKHLRNLYVYFWRWATWKVFDHHPESTAGIICFITVAGFLNGPGFQKMRWYLRRKCDEIWVIDCSPEGHQPEVNTRIFQDVQQPICIVLASRSPKSDEHTPAVVRFRALPADHREGKFKALQAIRLDGEGWRECPTPRAKPTDDAGSDPEWRAPFLPASTGAWSSYPRLEDLFIYNGSGVMPGRTWVIAPDVVSLERRWQKLVAFPLMPLEERIKQMEPLFHPHLRHGHPGDKHVNKMVRDPLPGFPINLKSVAQESGPCLDPVRYGYRSFDRQWIIPDSRLINQPNPTLWEARSNRQVYLTALARSSPSSGPAITLTGSVPDLDHYKGSFGGRVFPLWSDGDAAFSNIRPHLLTLLSKRFGFDVTAEALFAYIAAVMAHPEFTTRFRKDLAQPGLRIPLTADPAAFTDATDLGRRVIWLHTFGERMVDPQKSRPSGPPRLPHERAPFIPKEGAIPQDVQGVPDSIDYDFSKRRLLVGKGFVENVAPGAWNYEVSGKQVLVQWFSYRKRNRDRPIIGDRRPPSPLGDIQPDSWQAEYTSELLNVLHVLTLLVEMEPTQATLLERICAGPTLPNDKLAGEGAFELPPKVNRAAIKKQIGRKKTGQTRKPR